ncbi:MAG: hypothetical protein K2N07_06450 [Desulfovibrio sp.]|nr:hypothetical protein [Desulfovibrio sp.]
MGNLESALQETPQGGDGSSGDGSSADTRQSGEAPITFQDLLIKDYTLRHRYKKFLFHGSWIVCVGVLIFFLCFLCCSERPLKLLALSPFAAIPMGIIGLVPAVIVYALFKGIYDVRIIDRRDMDALQKMLDLLLK